MISLLKKYRLCPSTPFRDATIDFQFVLRKGHVNRLFFAPFISSTHHLSSLDSAFLFPLQMVIVGDDCALPPPRGLAGRRGLAGTLFVHKVRPTL